jgi:hypothetical protein
VWEDLVSRSNLCVMLPCRAVTTIAGAIVKLESEDEENDRSIEDMRH